MKQLRKAILNINGADRMFICDPAADSLADVLRRLGLTGTKIGCGIGVCGACSVILNGEVVRSCNKKMRNIENYSQVITIEGIGSPMHLHPLQQAWIYYGGVQCGFCSPGFIVSAYALLQDNPDPTREEVRNCFKKNKNICRCTGYKQLVDAVMAAAKVMRGEATMEDITYEIPENGEYFGTRVPNPNALAKVTGLCDYGDDIAMKMPSCTLHAAVVQPKLAHHAKILNIDYSEAEQMPGVFKVVTAKDVKGTNRLHLASAHPRVANKDFVTPIFCEDTIYRYGDVVALVCADTREHAREAAARVKVEIEKLPEYLSFSEAAAPDAMRIHPESPNVFTRQPLVKGNYPQVLEMIGSAPHAVSASFYSSREPHLSIEGDTVQAYYDEDGMMTIQCKSQFNYGSRNTIAPGIGLKPEELRIVLNPAGGSFGWSMSNISYAMTAAAAMACDRPVEMTMTYEEFMHHSGKRSPSCSNVSLSCDEQGMMNALAYEFGSDAGPYSLRTTGIPPRLATFIGWPYKIPNILGMSYCSYTNHNYCTTYRGYGAPQAFTASEGIVDMLARKIGMDPFEFRYQNLADPEQGDLTPTSREYVQNSYAQLFDTMRPHYQEALRRAKEADTPELRRGVGVAIGGFTCTNGRADSANAIIKMKPNGIFEVYNTWQDVGQNGDAGNVLLVCESLKPLGVTPDKVRVCSCDTKYAPDSGPSAGSRSQVMNGFAIREAALNLLQGVRREDGSYRSYEELVAENLPTDFEGAFSYVKDANDVDAQMSPNTGHGFPFPLIMYGLVCAEVEVNTKTGKVRCLSYYAVVDVGRVANENSLLGQAYGGASHCIGFALSENYEDITKHNNMAACGVPQITDIPDGTDMEFICLENMRIRTPHGASGCSESFQSGGHMAVINAIDDACGVRIYDLPATADKVKKGLEEIAQQGAQTPPAKYYISDDFVEDIYDCIDNPVPFAGNDDDFVKLH